jgi:signal transduction histidine kinase
MLLGWSMQTRARHIDALEHGQEEAALRAAADERLRIAQELHDIVAHSLGVIAVQAGVGMHVVDTDAAEARRALENISRTSRSSLAEIRRLLGVLRNADGTPAYTPAPGLADLPRLTREVADAGLPVDVSVDGDLNRVPAGVGLAAYRIVQEALTNTLRHAQANRARVHLDSTSGVLLIEVTDDGRSANGAAPGGHGLVGMRERVAVYGGSLDAGPARGGGFRVAARLPYDADPTL